MRKLLNEVKQTPKEKLQHIAEMVNKLLKVSQWDKWDIKVEEKPEVIKSRKLAVPELIHKEGEDVRLFVNEPLLKKMPIFNGDKLTNTTLIMLYDGQQVRNDVVANSLKNLMNCQKQMGMDSKEIVQH